MAKEKLPDSILEMISRDKASFAEVAAHMGIGEQELVNQYDLTGVVFPETSGPDVQAEAQQPPAQ